MTRKSLTSDLEIAIRQLLFNFSRDETAFRGTDIFDDIHQLKSAFNRKAGRPRVTTYDQVAFYRSPAGGSLKTDSAIARAIGIHQSTVSRISREMRESEQAAAKSG